MLDISVIILTYNEEMHIRRCLENVNRFASHVFVVDCFSTDKTVEIAESLGATVVQHTWPGNQAEQFNWALKNLVITTKWILRLDADEYLMPELIEELNRKLPDLADDVTGVIFNRRHIFMGEWMKRGIYPVKLLRLFQTGKGVCEQRLMDEHIHLRGAVADFDGAFVDHNLNDLSWWTRKHDGYALREAVDLLMANDATSKKRLYRRLPLFWRAAAYFCYRYIVRLGFLDGREGFLWHFLQGWWYRTLVDAKILELRNICGGGANPSDADLRNYLRTKGILLPDER